MQEKRAGDNSDIIDNEIAVVVDKLLENKRIATKQHKFFYYLKVQTNEKYEFNLSILKSDDIRYSRSEVSTINTVNSQMYFEKPREVSVISLFNIYLDWNFDAINYASGIIYAEKNDIRLVNSGPIALFREIKLKTSVNKHLEDSTYCFLNVSTNN